MESRRLPFGEVALRDDGLLEVAIDGGIEVDAAMIAELGAAFDSLVDAPTGLLVVRRNSYSLTHDALVAIGELASVTAVGIVVFSSLSWRVAETHAVYDFEMKVFGSEDEAARWLQGQGGT